MIGPIPKGVFYPMCGMNIAFKRKMLPYMYFAPMGHRVGMDRFGDIWCGIESKKVIDKKGWAVITGLASVKHKRASNVFTNLVKEAKGLGLNETYWKGDKTDPYFKLYADCRKRWKTMIQNLDTSM
jgi:reversibly glycosylated polypeptide/UDP-arabinopyranose mutase